MRNYVRELPNTQKVVKSSWKTGISKNLRISFIYSNKEELENPQIFFAKK